MQDLWNDIINTLGFGWVTSESTGEGVLDALASAAINWAAIIAGTILVLFIIYGGFMYLTSAGEPQKVEQGQKTIVNGIIGFVIVVLAWSLTSFLMYMFGVGAEVELPKKGTGESCNGHYECESGFCNPHTYKCE